jgi:hypothetical protein
MNDGYYVFDAPGQVPRYTVVFLKSHGVSDGKKWYRILGCEEGAPPKSGDFPGRLDRLRRPQLGNKLKPEDIPAFVKIAATMMRP